MIIILLAAAHLALASETDQYHIEKADLADLAPAINERVNREIAGLVQDWKPRWGVDPDRFAAKIRLRADGRYMFGRTSTWIEGHKDVPHERPPRGEDWLYHKSKIWNAPSVVIHGLASTVVVNGVRMGSDKMSHFFGFGIDYYRLERARGRIACAYEPEFARCLREFRLPREEISAFGVATEAGVWGAKTTGTFSNADLVANYEGLVFYRSLFEDGEVEGKSAILRWSNGMPEVLRPFAIEDHATLFWNEAWNPSSYEPETRIRVVASLRRLCSREGAAPGGFAPDEALLEGLYSRYGWLGLRQDPDLRGDRVCAALLP